MVSLGNAWSAWEVPSSPSNFFPLGQLGTKLDQMPKTTKLRPKLTFLCQAFLLGQLGTIMSKKKCRPRSSRVRRTNVAYYIPPTLLCDDDAIKCGYRLNHEAKHSYKTKGSNREKWSWPRRRKSHHIITRITYYTGAADQRSRWCLRRLGGILPDPPKQKYPEAETIF